MHSTGAYKYIYIANPEPIFIHSHKHTQGEPSRTHNPKSLVRKKVKFLLLCFLLGNLLLDQAMAKGNILLQRSSSSSSSSSSSNPLAEAPLIRKLGKQSLSPSMAPESEKKLKANGHAKSSVVGAENEAGGALGSDDEDEKDYSHHSSIDKSIAGGGVILGGLATTFLVAVFCYIRATARHIGDSHSTP